MGREARLPTGGTSTEYNRSDRLSIAVILQALVPLVGICFGIIFLIRMSLNNIKVVLIGTSHPGNIGATARAMKAMGLARLALVQPKVFPHAEATARAAGADDLLAHAELHDSLADAVKECQLVIGTSARARYLDWPVLNAREFAGVALKEAEAGQVALVFGRENNGLSNGELDLCNRLVHIPTNPEFGSLNLAAAVQVMAYELYATLRAQEAGAQVKSREVVGPGEVGEVKVYPTSSEVEGFFAHLEATLLQIGFLDRRYPRKLMRRMRLIFHRVRMDRIEMNILRGILSATGKAVAGPGGQALGNGGGVESSSNQGADSDPVPPVGTGRVGAPGAPCG